MSIEKFTVLFAPCLMRQGEEQIIVSANVLDKNRDLEC